jgi:hypothetical protein
MRETKPSFHRPVTRRLINLTNDELSLLFKLRADEVADSLKGHEFWDDNRIVYWNKFILLQDRLFEVMMEIQSRYPAKEVRDYQRLLPVMEPNEEV